MRALLAWAALALTVPGAAVQGAAPAETAWVWQLPRGFPVPIVPADNPMSVAKVELGRRLFGETRVSVTGRYSCASCHAAARAFTDGRVQAVGVHGNALRRNTMTLTNVAYTAAFNWASDGITTLEQQMLVPLLAADPVEMGLAGRESELLAWLGADAAYRAAFAAAFPADVQPVTLDNLVRAIAAYERTLISGRSAFDRFVFDDDRSAMSESARRGMALFYSDRTSCGVCHAGINFQGPARSVQNPQGHAMFANTGLYDVDGKGGYPAVDQGLLEVSAHPRDNGRFRVPTLRNVARTAPYMHDGSIATLPEVIDHYNRGGRHRPAAAVVLTDPLIRPLGLEPRDKADLLAFLESLDDPDFSRP